MKTMSEYWDTLAVRREKVKDDDLEFLHTELRRTIRVVEELTEQVQAAGALAERAPYLREMLEHIDLLTGEKEPAIRYTTDDAQQFKVPVPDELYGWFMAMRDEFLPEESAEAPHA